MTRLSAQCASIHFPRRCRTRRCPEPIKYTRHVYGRVPPDTHVYHNGGREFVVRIPPRISSPSYADLPHLSPRRATAWARAALRDLRSHAPPPSTDVRTLSDLNDHQL
jgi:hypothetical protein